MPMVTELIFSTRQEASEQATYLCKLHRTGARLEVRGEAWALVFYQAINLESQNTVVEANCADRVRLEALLSAASSEASEPLEAAEQRQREASRAAAKEPGESLVREVAERAVHRTRLVVEGGECPASVVAERNARRAREVAERNAHRARLDAPGNERLAKAVAERVEHLAKEAAERRGEREAFKARLLTNQHRDADKIKVFISERKIDYLYHFTRVENINNILARGVLPRCSVPSTAIRNDHQRLDGQLDAISLSIGYINYKLFWTYHLRNESAANWALFHISPEILQDTPCLFFSTNAANTTFSSLNEKELLRHTGVNGLVSLYSDEPLGARAERGLRSYWTTDPQAEILAFKPIMSSQIRGVTLFRFDKSLEQDLQFSQPHWQLRVGQEPFKNRGDSEHWPSGASLVIHPTVNDLTVSTDNEDDQVFFTQG